MMRPERSHADCQESFTTTGRRSHLRPEAPRQVRNPSTLAKATARHSLASIMLALQPSHMTCPPDFRMRIKFIAGLAPLREVVLNPKQVKAAWINPAFLAKVKAAKKT